MLTDVFINCLIKQNVLFSTYVDVESYHYRIISSSFNTLHQVSSVDIPTCMCFQKQRGSSALEKDKKSTSRRLKRAKQQKQQREEDAEITAAIQAKHSQCSHICSWLYSHVCLSKQGF